MEVCSLYENVDKKQQRQQFGMQQMHLFDILHSSAPGVSADN
jgi:hypothetical protein